LNPHSRLGIIGDRPKHSSSFREGRCKGGCERVCSSLSGTNKVQLTLGYSIDEKRLATVVEEIKAAGGDAIGVAGDVGADDFPKRIVDATVQYVDC
jgi:hypothetical protein